MNNLPHDYKAPEDDPEYDRLFAPDISGRLPLIFHFLEADPIQPALPVEIWEEGVKSFEVDFYQTNTYTPEIFYKPISKIWKI